MGHPAYTITPQMGRTLQLVAGGMIDGQPVVALFVGNDSRPIILSKGDVAELVTTMAEIIEGAL